MEPHSAGELPGASFNWHRHHEPPPSLTRLAVSVLAVAALLASLTYAWSVWC